MINIKKLRGRPPFPVNDVRTVRRGIFFSPTEMKRVVKRAVAAGLAHDVPAYIRAAALGAL